MATSFDWRAYATQVANDLGLEPRWLLALIRGESGGQASIKSPAGAIGYTQLMPATAASLGVNPYDPRQNIQGGGKYLKQQLDRFGTYPLALAAYNAGPNAVQRYGGIPPYKETQTYVKRVSGYAAEGSGAGNPGTTAYGPKQGANRDEAEAIMRKHGLTASSNDRTPQQNAAANGVPNSKHLTTRTDVWALDGVGTETAMQNAKTEIAREVDDVLELMIHDAGSGRHLHAAGKAGGSGNAGSVAGGASDASSSSASDTTLVGMRESINNAVDQIGENLIFITILGVGLLAGGGLVILGAFGATGRGAKVGPIAIGGTK